METPIPANNQEYKDLMFQKGELVTQLEIAQGKLQQVNMRISQILNLGQNTPVQPK